MTAMNREQAEAFMQRLEAKAAKKVAGDPAPTALSDNDLLDAAIKDGKFLASSRAHYAKRLKSDGPATRALIDSLHAFPGLAAMPTPTRASVGSTPAPSRFATQVSAGGEVFDVPLPSTPRPTLFADGDLPPVTASGIDPSLLTRVPWQARHALARASTHGEASMLLERYGGPDGATQASVDAMSGGPLAVDVADYEQRMSRWASGSDQ